MIVSSRLLFLMDSSWHNDAISVKVSKDFEQFELVMKFGSFGQTTVDQSLWILYETFRWSKWNPKFEFLHDFIENLNQIGSAWCKHHLACDCAPLCHILGHLNNARLINGPQVANWGWQTWSTHIVHQLWDLICRERLFLHTFIIFNGH